MGEAVEKYKRQQAAKPTALVQTIQRKIIPTLPAGVDRDRWAKLIEVAIGNPAIARCSAPSLLKSVSDAAKLNLEIAGPLGDASIIPYKGKAQLQIEYRGMIKLVMRGGDVKSVAADIIREGDYLDFELGDKPYLKHKPNILEPGAIKGAYAIAHFADVVPKIRVLSLKEIEAARMLSPYGKDGKGPWADHYESMAKKTAIKRLCSDLPRFATSQVKQAIELESAPGVSVGSDDPIHADAEIVEGGE